MASLPFHASLEQKKKYFKNTSHYIINDEEGLEKWYEKWKAINEEAGSGQYIFRGANEAKYMLFNTAQRKWNEKIERKKHGNYRDYFTTLLNIAKNNAVFKKVFEFYKLDKDEIDFPLMSLLQHYKGPSPFLDWTYNFDVALYFAIDGIKHEVKGGINDYFSVYTINKHKAQIKRLVPGKESTIQGLIERMRTSNTKRLNNDDKNKDDKSYSSERLVYVSDFEESESENEKDNVKYIGGAGTALYNQNIIPQQGLFIFNPSRTIPLEEYKFNDKESGNVQIRCCNIHKALNPLLYKKLAASAVNKAFIYPTIGNIVASITKEMDKVFFT